jgi:aspartyl-tRNA(Asn)/glutamyl-tRNA(Gln) amidotransferase subunit A
MYRETRDQGFGAEVKRRILLGTYALSAGYYDAYYRKAQQVRTLLTRDFLAAFAEVDAIVAPITPTPAWKLGAKADDPVQMYLEDIYSVAASLAGICGISVPCGETTGRPGLPIGSAGAWAGTSTRRPCCGWRWRWRRRSGELQSS